MIDERSLLLFKYHKHYRAGILFSDGGVSSQPNVYLEAMELIESHSE